MKSAAHQYEDKLLEFAYGELPQHEAEAVDAHVRGCNRCSQSLSEIRGVRAAMARLPMEPAPDAGLESLLAYAEQAAKRNAAEAKPAPSFFKKFLMPLASLAALVTVGVVGFRASQQFETTPAAAIADQKVAAMEEKAREKNAEEQAAKIVAQTEKPSAGPQAQPSEAVAVPPVVAAAAPEAPPADPSYELPANRAVDSKKLEAKNEPKPEPKKDAPADRNDGKDNTAKEGGAADELLAQDYRNALGGKGSYDKSGTRDVWSPEQQKSAPQSEGKRSKTAAPAPEVPVGNAEIARQQNFSDVGMRGAKLERQELAKEVAKTPPPPPPAPPQEKPSYGYGLGTSSPGAGSAQGVMGGSTGGASTPGDAPSALSQATTKPSPVAPPPKADPMPAAKNEKADLDDSVIAAKKREEKEKVAAAKDAQAKQAAEEDRVAEREMAPAPVAAAPMPSAPPSTSTYAPAKKKSGSFGIGVNKPQINSSSPSMSAGADLESEVAEQSDQLRVDSDTRAAARSNAKAVTQYVENARVASSRGDRMTEIRLLAQALQAGATGYEKTEALKRICDAYNALGEPERADPFCDQLVQEFPNTAAAQAVMSERRKAQRTAPAPKKPAAAERRYSDDASPAPKPAEAAPAQAY